MGDIFIQNNFDQGVTVISNRFIDRCMAGANGEFVKVYLYLLRLTQGEHKLSLASIADFFNCTERDVTRALKYWEKEGLLRLTREDRRLTGITLLDVPPDGDRESAAGLEETVKQAVPEEKPAVSAPIGKEKPERKRLTAGQKEELREQEEVRQFLYIAEQYLGRTLSRTDVDNLLYFYAELHFSADLIEYLVEYCVSKGSRSARYIEAVALAWAEEGISTVEEAKSSVSMYNKAYFSIMKAMGIKERYPVEMERKMMDSWMQDLGFSLELIMEACQRTVMQTGQASFPYADSILKGWSKKNVRHLSDLAALDEEHKKRAARIPAKNASHSGKTVEYPHRSYDYEKIQKTLFNQ